MNRDKKIEKINAYKKLIESKKLPVVKAVSSPGSEFDHLSVEEQIGEEFSAWAENQLEVLMGERNKLDGDTRFSNEEFEVLKVFAAKVIAKTSGDSRPAPTAAPSNVQNGSSLRPKQSAPARAEAAPQNGRPVPEPLGNRGTTSVQAQKIRDRNPGEPVGRVAKTKGLSLEELDQMADAIEDN